MLCAVPSTYALLMHWQCATVQGYQFTCATRRSYWLHWDTPYQLSPETFSLHKPDLMNATHGWLYLTAKWPQVCFGMSLPSADCFVWQVGIGMLLPVVASRSGCTILKCAGSANLAN